MSEGHSLNHDMVTSGSDSAPESSPDLLKPQSPSLEQKKPITTESLASRAGEIVGDFFRQTSVNAARIEDGIKNIRAGSNGLHEGNESNNRAIRLFREQPSNYQIDDILHSLKRAQTSLEEQLAETHRTFPRDGRTTHVLDALRQQEQVWIRQGGVSEFTTELENIAKEPNLVLRSQRLEALRQQIVAFTDPIERDAQRAYVATSRYSSETSNRTAAALGGIENAYYITNYLREKLGNDYFASRTNLTQAEEGIRYFRGRSGRAVEDLPFELRSISQAATSLGITITELFELMKQPQVSQ